LVGICNSLANSHDFLKLAPLVISDRPLPEATLPFWAWLLAQKPLSINGQRFQAQAEIWTVKP